MKITSLVIIAFVATIGLNPAFADEEKMHTGSRHHDMSMMDMRTSLGLSEQMKQHQFIEYA